MKDYKQGLVHVEWHQVKAGDTVWIDNYLDGQYPKASPKISGPYTVIDPIDRRLGKPAITPYGHRFLVSLMFYPQELLKKAVQE